jgi:hypothetical protein
MGAFVTMKVLMRLLPVTVLFAMPLRADRVVVTTDECPRVLLSLVCDSHEKRPCCPTYVAEAGGNIGPDIDKLNFVWSLSSGTIVEGEGSPVIRFETGAIKEDSIKVKLRVEGLENWPNACAKEIVLTIDPCKEKKKFART